MSNSDDTVFHHDVEGLIEIFLDFDEEEADVKNEMYNNGVCQYCGNFCCVGDCSEFGIMIDAELRKRG